jgi:hypothetical protein
MGHAGGLGLRLHSASGRTSFLVNEAVSYQPTYMYDLFPIGAQLQPGTTPTTAPDYSVNEMESYSYATSVSARREFTVRSRVTLTGDYIYTDRRRETPDWQDGNTRSFRGEYSHGVGPNTSMIAQYRYRHGDFGYGGRPKTMEHLFEFGVDHGRLLSPTRRVTFDFRIGASSANLPENTIIGFVIRRQYQAIGQAGLGYDFGRTWQARMTFRRGLEYIVDLPEPVFADGLSASLAGLMSRRIDILASAGFSSGASLLNRNSLRFDTYTGNLRLRYALTRAWAGYVEYLYYYYDYSGNDSLPPGIPRGLERNGARAGLTLWVPALRR